MFKACLPEFVLSVLKNPMLLLDYTLWRRLFRKSDIKNKRAQFISEFPGVAQITIGAVDSEWRGKGVFPALVAALVQQSEKKGSRAIKVGIYKKNWQSRQVFIKGHWKEIVELETADTVFYMKFYDDTLVKHLGLEASAER
jgi:GNAT superfamily N-acetyltransferase